MIQSKRVYDPCTWSGLEHLTASKNHTFDLDQRRRPIFDIYNGIAPYGTCRRVEPPRINRSHGLDD